MEGILEDISMLVDDIKKLIQSKIYNKFCSLCQKWLFRKEFIIGENNRHFCSQECLESNKRIWEATKNMIDYLVKEILPESMSETGKCIDVKSE